MTKLHVFICMMLFASCSFSQEIVDSAYYKHDTKLGGEATIVRRITTVKDDEATTTFEFYAPITAYYYIQFWMCPTQLADGTFATYKVQKNNETSLFYIQPEKSGWQAISLYNRDKIILKPGLNRIDITGQAPDVPNIEHIRISTNQQESIIDTTAYTEYRRKVENSINTLSTMHYAAINNLPDTLAATFTTMAIQIPNTGEDPLYDFEYRQNMRVKYTFYKYLYFQKGQKIHLETNGVNYFSHVLELFSYNTPESFSISAMSDGNCKATMDTIAGNTGIYVVRVRSFRNARYGLCNLNINNENYYKNILIFSIGIRCFQDSKEKYNTFTCNAIGTPMLFIEEGTTTPGTINTFNFGYSGSGDFDWEKYSRINKKYMRSVHAAILSSYSSYVPTGSCDLYARCKGYDFSKIKEGFKNLKRDDAIQSSPATDFYNCVGWAGGSTFDIEWPLDECSDFYREDKDSLASFDDYFASKGFTRKGATATNGVVALWAYVWNNSREYLHASIRNGADNHVHGYDWESKLGALARMFHPRDALSGIEYGQIVEYYIRTADKSSFEEKIADGTMRIKYNALTEKEMDIINAIKEKINKGVMCTFYDLYSKWRNVTLQTIYNDPEQIANCKEYRDVFTYCKDHPILKYAVCDRIKEGDNVSAYKLLKDLTFKQKESILEKIRNSNAKDMKRSNVKIFTPLHSKYIEYVKEMLADFVNDNTSEERSHSYITYSNSTDFSIRQNSESLCVDFSLDKSQKVILRIINIPSYETHNYVNNQKLSCGTHTITVPAESGKTYLVCLIVDGHVNIKKIITH